MSATVTCDADNVAPAAYAVITQAGPLLLCGHHYREHAVMLGLMGYPVDSLTPVRVPEHRLVFGTPGGPRVVFR